MSELLWCMQDMQVRPIILNKRIEKVAASHLDAKSLPFDAKVTDAASHYEGAHPDEVGDLVSAIQKSLGDKTSMGDKLNIMAYLERLCASAVLSDFIVGSELCLMLVRMMRKTKSTPLRGRVAHVLGLLIRHATFLPVELQGGGLVVALSEGMRDRDARVRRNSMAAFGELLFYMTSQVIWLFPSAILTLFLLQARSTTVSFFLSCLIYVLNTRFHAWCHRKGKAETMLRGRGGWTKLGNCLVAQPKH